MGRGKYITSSQIRQRTREGLPQRIVEFAAGDKPKPPLIAFLSVIIMFATHMMGYSLKFRFISGSCNGDKNQDAESYAESSTNQEEW